MVTVIVASVGATVEVTVWAGKVIVIVERTNGPLTLAVLVTVTAGFEIVVHEDCAVRVAVIVIPAISLVTVLV